MLKRYNVSLDEETVEKFKVAARSFKMAPNAMSVICNEAIEKTLGFLQHAQKHGTPTLTDLFVMIGKETQAIMDGEVALAKEDVQRKMGKKAIETGTATAEPARKQRAKRV